MNQYERDDLLTVIDLYKRLKWAHEDEWREVKGNMRSISDMQNILIRYKILNDNKEFTEYGLQFSKECK